MIYDLIFRAEVFIQFQAICTHDRPTDNVKSFDEAINNWLQIL